MYGLLCTLKLMLYLLGPGCFSVAFATQHAQVSFFYLKNEKLIDRRSLAITNGL